MLNELWRNVPAHVSIFALRVHPTGAAPHGLAVEEDVKDVATRESKHTLRLGLRRRRVVKRCNQNVTARVRFIRLREQLTAHRRRPHRDTRGRGVGSVLSHNQPHGRLAGRRRARRQRASPLRKQRRLRRASTGERTAHAWGRRRDCAAHRRLDRCDEGLRRRRARRRVCAYKHRRLQRRRFPQRRLRSGWRWTFLLHRTTRHAQLLLRATRNPPRVLVLSRCERLRSISFLFYRVHLQSDYQNKQIKAAT